MLNQSIEQLFKKYNKIIRFCISGAISASIDLVLLVFCVEILKFEVVYANVISFSAALVNGYIFNKYWTFKDSSKKHVSQFSKFFFVSAIGLTLNTVLMILLLKINMWYVFAKMVIILIVAFWNFTANNLWTFNYQKEANT